jgi:hypothetical protein
MITIEQIGSMVTIVVVAMIKVKVKIWIGFR